MRRQPGTYALLLRSLDEQRIQVGNLGALTVRQGTYVYAGSAFGPGGVLARLRHHCHLARSPYWHIDFLRQVTDIEEIWYSHDPEQREHQWAQMLMTLRGAALPLMGFGSSDCTCASHLFLFAVPPRLRVFRRRIRQVIPRHHPIGSVQPSAVSFQQK